VRDVDFHCETCGNDFTVLGEVYVIGTERGVESHFDPLDGETPRCPNEPSWSPSGNGTRIVEHDISLVG